jgi:hypothetical protein
VRNDGRGDSIDIGLRKDGHGFSFIKRSKQFSPEAMSNQLHRRSFLKRSIISGAAMGFGDFGFLSRLPRVSASEANVSGNMVQFRPEIEPLVRLVEETSRDRLLEEIADQIRRGTTYRDVLSALLLAGVRNIQPRPVGFKFHAVLVVNAAHLASQNSPDSDRWLPIFWALDYFKSSQAQDIQEGDWTMAPVNERLFSKTGSAQSTFADAMDRWDEEQVDAAVAQLARTAGANEVFDLFCRYGARDYRDIGHKAIYVANSWRTLQTIGWQHSEPVLRSLAYALLMHNGSNPAERDDSVDRPGRVNQQRIKEVRPGWQSGELDPAATREMLTMLRDGDSSGTSAKVVELLNKGVAPQSVWDALFQSAGELLMRRPGIVTLHTCTTTNALHYAFQHASSEETRLYVLLQNAAFIPLFREDAGARTGVNIDLLEPVEPKARGAAAVDEIFSALSSDRQLAAQKTLAYLNQSSDVSAFINSAQRLIYLKGTNSHDYKFSSAVLEDYFSLSPAIRNRFLAASVYWLKGADENDSPLVARSRSALNA